MKSKKGISPVIATALLIIVAVVSVISFQNWFGLYSSNLFSKTEIESSNTISTSGIENLIGSELYIRNSNTQLNLSITQIKINNQDCNLSGNYSYGIWPLDITSCIRNLTTKTPEVVVYTTNNIYSKQFLIKEIITLSSSLNCKTDVDTDTFISPICAIYPVTNFDYEGDFDTNDANASIHVDMNCVFKGYKNSVSCLNNLVVDGCGSGTVLDVSTNICWQRDFGSPPVLRNWANSISYCDNLVLGGSSNWRLPTNQELLSIRDLSRVNPSVIGGNNNKFLNIANGFYWTSSSYGPNKAAYAFTIRLDQGINTYGAKTDNYYSVCVR